MASRTLTAGALIEALGEWRGFEPTYAALAERIRLLVVDGRLPSGVRLPSERSLSARLGVSRTTVTHAYRLLGETGHAAAVRGSGTTVRVPAPAHGRSPRIDLAMATLPATERLAAAAAVATEGLSQHLAGPGYHLVGLPELRRAVAERYTARGLTTDPEQILITPGAQSAIALLARTHTSRGDRVMTESPTYPHAIDALRIAGTRVGSSPVEVGAGWDMDTMTGTIRRIRPTLLYTMPDFHNPTGRSMSTADREQLLEAAEEVGTVVLADETTADLNIDRPDRFGPLGATNGDADVVHIGSASKVFWGGLRVGWIRTGAESIRQLSLARSASDLGAPLWEQLVVTELLTDVEPVLQERRVQLRARRDALLGALDRALPQWRPPPHLQGGLAAWVQLPAPVSSQLALHAHAAGVQITAGPRFAADGAYERHIRIPLTAEPSELDAAVERLSSIWTEVIRHPIATGLTRDGIV